MKETEIMMNGLKIGEDGNEAEVVARAARRRDPRLAAPGRRGRRRWPANWPARDAGRPQAAGA